MSTLVEPAPAPSPQDPPAPFGDLSKVTVPELCDHAMEILRDASEGCREKRRAGIRMLFDHLSAHPGETWQERWEATDFNAEDAPSVSVLAASKSQASGLTSAMRMAFGMRIIQPSLPGFRVNRFSGYAEPFRSLQDDPALDEFFKVVDTHTRLNPVHKHRAKFDVTCALTTQGIALEHLTPSVLLHYSLENKRLGSRTEPAIRTGPGSPPGLPGKCCWRWGTSLAGRLTQCVPASNRVSTRSRASSIATELRTLLFASY
ncbi:hypothetical protein ACIQNI_32035 [Streptomyces sp. NPDC091266]|uniref:hypothetical protein n=1 Tax=Streptomyces sp. NPDC091266 TaxID=3365978 RepID=UPI003824E943